MPSGCPKGTRRNKKTGLCEKKKSPAKKRNTLKQSSSSKSSSKSSSRSSLSRSSSSTSSLPKQEDTLSAKEVDEIMDEFNEILKGKKIDQDIMKSELMKLTYNENYRTQFSNDEPPGTLQWMAHNMIEQFLKEGYKTFNVEQMLREGIYE